MALVANLVRTSVTNDGLQSIFSDNTIYGGANPNRASVAVYLSAYKVDESLVETPLIVTTSQTALTPNTNTTFNVNNGVDGNTKYYFIIVNNWLIDTTFNKYDLTFDTTQQKFYQYVNNTPSAGNLVTDTTYWSLVTDPTSKLLDIGTALEPTNIVYQIMNKIVDYKTATCFTKLGILNAKENCDNIDYCNTKTYKLFAKIRSLLTSMRLDESQQLWVSGERAARLAERYCDECGCITR